MKRLSLLVLILLLGLLCGLFATTSTFKSLVGEARSGQLTESDLQRLVGVIPTHEIDALREIMYNPRAYTDIDRQSPNRSHTVTSNNLTEGSADEFGFVVANAGNVTNAAAGTVTYTAGLQALLVGAPYYDNGRGRVYLYLSSTKVHADGVGAAATDREFDNTADRIWEGEEEGSLFGYALGSNIDLNPAAPVGGAITDIVIGAPRYGNNDIGKVYIIGGDATWAQAASAVTPVRVPAAATPAGPAGVDIELTGSVPYEYFGSSFAYAENIDAEGGGGGAEWHLAVGAYGYSSTGDPVPDDFRGRVYFFDDDALTSGANIVDSAAMYKVNGANEGDMFGYTLANGGGVIADQTANFLDSVVAGAPGANNNKGLIDILSDFGGAATSGMVAANLGVVTVKGHYAYVAENNAANTIFRIFDISDLTNPMQTGLITGVPANINFIVVDDIEANAVIGYGTSLRSINITDKYAPAVNATLLVGGVAPWLGATICGNYVLAMQGNLVTSANLATLAASLGTINIANITDLDPTAAPHGVAIASSGNDVYITVEDTDAADVVSFPSLHHFVVTAAGALEDGNSVASITDQSDAVLLPGPGSHMMVSNNVAYITSGVSVNYNIVVPTTINGTNYVVVADGGMLKTYDVSTTASIELMDAIGVGGTIGAIALNASGNIAFVSYRNSNGTYIASYSLTNPANLTLLDVSDALGTNANVTSMVLAGAANDYLVFIGTFAAAPTNRLCSLDISDPFDMQGIFDSKTLGANAGLKVIADGGNLFWSSSTDNLLHKSTIALGTITVGATTANMGFDGSYLAQLGNFVYAAGGTSVRVYGKAALAATGAAVATSNAVTAMTVHDADGTAARVYAMQNGAVESLPVADQTLGVLGVLNTTSTYAPVTPTCVATFATDASGHVYMTEGAGLAVWNTPAAALANTPTATINTQALISVPVATPSDLDGGLSNTNAQEGKGGLVLDAVEVPTVAERAVYSVTAMGIGGTNMVFVAADMANDAVKSINISDPSNLGDPSESTTFGYLNDLSASSTGVAVICDSGLGLFTAASPAVMQKYTQDVVTHKIINGEQSGDLFGWSMAPMATDLLTDTSDELLVGAPNAGSLSGKVYIIAEQNRALLCDPASANWTGTDGRIFMGENAGDHIGYKVATGNIGDVGGGVDGDTRHDVIFSSTTYNTNTGRVYAIWNGTFVGLGGTNLSVGSLVDAANNAEGQTLDGENTNDRFGWDIAVGDFANDQGSDDLAISAPHYGSDTGMVYLYRNGVVPYFTANPTNTTIGTTVSFTGTTVNFPGNILTGGGITASSYDWNVDLPLDHHAGDEETGTTGTTSWDYTVTGVYDPKLTVEVAVAGYNAGAATDCSLTRDNYITINPLLTTEAYEYKAPGALDSGYAPLTNGQTLELGGTIRYTATIGAAVANVDSLTWHVFSSISNQPDSVVVKYLRPEATTSIQYIWNIGTNASVHTEHFGTVNGHGMGYLKATANDVFTLRFDLGDPVHFSIATGYNPPAITVAAGNLKVYTANTYVPGVLLTSSSATPSIVPTMTDPLYIQVQQTDGYGYGPYTMQVSIKNDDTEAVYGYVTLTQLDQPNQDYFRGIFNLASMGITAPANLRIQAVLDTTYAAKVLFYNSNNVITNAAFARADGTTYGTAESEQDLRSALYIKVTGTLPANPYVYLSSHTVDYNGILVRITGSLTQVQLGLESDATTVPPTISYKVGEKLYLRAVSVAAPASGVAPNPALDDVTVNSVDPIDSFGLWAPANNSMAVDINPPFRWNRWDGTAHNRGLADVTRYLLYVGKGTTQANAVTDLIAHMDFSNVNTVNGITCKGTPYVVTEDLFAYLTLDLPQNTYVAWDVIAVSGTNYAYAVGNPEVAGTINYGTSTDAAAGDINYTAGGNIDVSPYNGTGNECFIFKTWSADEANSVYFPTIDYEITRDRTFNAANTYYMCGTPSVAPGVDLVIPAGTTLKFCQGTSLTANGNLYVEGTASSHVVMTALNTTQTWGGIIYPANPTIARDILVVNDTDLSYTSGIIVKYVDFSYSTNPVIANQDIYLSNNTLNSTDRGGFVVNSGSYVMSNVIDGIASDAITGGAYVNGNVISNVTGYAITTADNGTARSNAITNVTKHAIWGASTITDNSVVNCTSSESLIKSTNLVAFNYNGQGANNGIEQNTVTGTGNAIVDVTVTSSTAAEFLENKILNNTADYIVKVNGTRINLNANQVSYNTGSATDAAGINITVTGASQMYENVVVHNTGTQTKGGGLYVGNAAGTLQVENNDFAFNYIAQTASRGAGVYVNAGTVYLVANDIGYNKSAEYPGVYINAGANVYLATNNIQQNSVWPAATRAAGTNYAVYGNPVQMTGNYLWMNSADVDLTATIPANAAWDTDYPLSGRSYEFRYTGSTEFVAPQNCYGSRNDMGYIDPTIYDNDEDATLGSVRYQPMNTDLPLSVSAVLDLTMVGSGYSHSSLRDGARYQITTDCIGMVQIDATRGTSENPYTEEITNAKVENLTTGAAINEIIAYQKSAEDNGHCGFFYVSSTTTDSDRGILKAQVGDVIKVSSLQDPSKYILLDVVQPRLTVDDVTIPEDTPYSINVWDHALVPMGRHYGLTCSSASNFTVTEDNLNLSFVPKHNWNGSESFTITMASDDNQFVYTDTFTINVTSVNDQPEAATPFALVAGNSLIEDFGTRTIDLSTLFTDPENDAISYSVQCDEQKVQARIDGHNLILVSVLNANTNVNGYTPITITASDNVNRAGTPEVVDLNIAPINDAPVIVDEEVSRVVNDYELSVKPGEQVSFKVLAEDVDSPVTYKWKIMSGDDYLNYNVVESDSMSYTFANRDVYTVEITASDGQYQDQRTYTVYSGVPAYSYLKGNYPNPFNPTTTISFYIKDATPITVDIYNVKGQKVRSINAGQMEKGFRNVVWNGRLDNGNSAASGVYMYRVSGKNINATSRMILVK